MNASGGGTGRVIMGTTKITIWVTWVVNRLTKSP